MLFLKRKITSASIVLLLVSLYTPIPAHAIDTAASSVLRFQQKMAEKGHAEYQYKLARMYESGNAIERDLDNARHWYQLAADQQFKPAQHRLNYLNIRQHGFTPEHQDWLEKIRLDAQYNDPEALFLLGQMYADGIGVEQDLNKSLKLLRKAAAGNIAESESEIRRVEKTQAEYEARELAAQRLKQQQEIAQAQAAQIALQKQQALLARQKQQALQQQALKQQQKAGTTQKQPGQIVQHQPPSPATVIMPQKTEAMPQDIADETGTNDICAGHNRFEATCR
jgi:TPR repeat protein